jgi:5-methyltetrahydropteroyltriglutamate--homocysteine methyltransferase
MAIATNLGYPRLGLQRELKWVLEKYWRGTENATALQRTAHDLRQTQQHLQQHLGI